MAITFLERRKKLRYLFPALIAVILITSFVLWQGFFVRVKPLPSEEIFMEVVKEEIEINFQILKNPLLKELTPFKQIPPFEQTPGRENPFVPY